MLGMVALVFGWLSSLLKSRRRLQAENLVFRHKVNILRRQAPGRTRLSNPDRLVFVWLYRLVGSKLKVLRRCSPHGRAAAVRAIGEHVHRLKSGSRQPAYQANARRDEL